MLGSGGMGVVYRAKQSALNRFVALKILPPEKSRSPHFQERFEREAQALAGLSHPNIVTIHDFGREGELFFLSMELLEGGSLRDRMKSGALTCADAVRLLTPVLDALDFAHGRGIVHRDVKPENILLDHDGRVKLADFGLSKLIEPSAPRLTASGATVGTAHYIAPEVIGNPEAADARVDVYAAGVVLYEMLSGRVPVGQFDPPTAIATVNAVVARALAPDPARRFATAAAFREALAGALDPPRGRGRILVIGGAVTVLLGVGVVLYRPSRPSKPQPVPPIIVPVKKPAPTFDPRSGVLVTHSMQVNSVAFSVDGTKLASAAEDGSVRLCHLADASTGAKSFRGLYAIHSIAFHPDGKSVATGGRGRFVHFWSVESGHHVKEIELDRFSVFSLAISREAGLLAVACATNDLRMWDMRSEKWGWNQSIGRELLSNRIVLVFEPAGTRLLCGDRSGEIQLREGGSGKILEKFQDGESAVLAVAFRPSGGRFASSHQDGSVLFWDVGNPRPVRRLSSGVALSVAFSPDGSLLALGADGAVLLWESETGREVQRLAMKGEVRALAFKPGGGGLVAGSSDGSVRMWKPQ